MQIFQTTRGFGEVEHVTRRDGVRVQTQIQRRVKLDVTGRIKYGVRVFTNRFDIFVGHAEVRTRRVAFDHLNFFRHEFPEYLDVVGLGEYRRFKYFNLQTIFAGASVGRAN